MNLLKPKHVQLTARQQRACNEISINISRVRAISANKLLPTFRVHGDAATDINQIIEACNRLDGYMRKALIKENAAVEWFKRLIS